MCKFLLNTSCLLHTDSYKMSHSGCITKSKYNLFDKIRCSTFSAQAARGFFIS